MHHLLEGRLVDACEMMAKANKQAAAAQDRHAELYERQLGAESAFRAERLASEEKAWAQRERETSAIEGFTDMVQQLARRMEMIERLVVDNMKKGEA